MKSVENSTLPAAATSPRVLLAEDDPSLRTLIAGALRQDGLDVIEIADGNALVDRLAEGVAKDGTLDGFNLIVSDIRMPGFSALEVMGGLRRLLARTPVVLITAFGDPRTHQRARQLGAAAVLDKPFDIDELRATVLGLLKKQEAGP